MTLRPLETGLCTLVMAAAATGVYGQFTTEPDSAPDLRLAIPRPPTSGTHDVGMALGGIAGGDPAASQSWGFEPGEGFTTAPGFIGGQVGWGGFAASTVEGHVDDANPEPVTGGVQHLRVSHDPAVLGADTLIGGFSPNMGVFQNASAVVSVDVFITGFGRNYEVVPQSPGEGFVVTRVRFENLNNVISVLDDLGAGAAFIDTGTTWIPDQYINLTIDHDFPAGTVTVSYDNIVIYTMVGPAFATSVQEVVLFGTNGGAGSGHVDFDSYDVVGVLPPTGACCNTDGMDFCEILDPFTCGAIVGAFYLGDDTLCANCPPVPDSCGPGAGDCLVPHLGPGCDDIECCALVCEALPFCCLPGFDWGPDCAAAALDTFCAPDLTCGDPLAGSCYGINQTPACSDAACCELVCASNPECCAVSWDLTCFLAMLAQCDQHQVIFGFTSDDFGSSNDCAAGETILTTQYVNTHSVVFGTAVDNFNPSVVVSGDHPACSGTCRSFGLPAAGTDWWCQFRLGNGPGVPGLRAGVDSFTAEVCLTTAPIGTVVLEGYDIDLAVVATAVSTQIGAETLTLTPPPEVLISYVRLVAGDPGQTLGLSIAWIDYPEAVAVEQVGFNPPDETPAAGEPNFQAVGDLDGDGTTDSVVVIPDLNPELPGSIQVFLNQGTDQSGVWQGFVPNPPMTVGPNPGAVTVGLFNLDPHLDLAVTNAADGTVSILFNQGLGDGSFLLVDTVLVGSVPTDVVSDDFDQDTFTDLVVTLGGDETFVVLVNDGAGNFTLLGAPEVPSFALSPRSMVTGDFDGNKCPDVAGSGSVTAASGLGGQVFVALGQGDGTFLNTLFDVGADPRDIAAGDLDGDGLPDLVVPNFADATVSILVNDGAGSYLPQVTVPVGLQPESVEVVDLNADGANDLVVVAVDDVIGPAVLVLLSTGEGLAFDAPLAFGVDANPNTVVSTDLDGDLLPDLITVNQDPDQETGGSVTALLSVPPSPPPCPWDCGGDDDGEVGIVDFLALLGQWTEVGTSCDFDGDGTGIVDFLALLGNWGPCP